MTFYQIVFLFFAYSFLGWVGEVLFTAVVHRKYQDRGVLSGPLCLLYGVGGLVITFALGDIREGWFFLLVFSAVYATVIEWIGGHILEYTTHTRWWDYSAMPFNLDGYVCLGASLTWGALGVVGSNGATRCCWRCTALCRAASGLLCCWPRSSCSASIWSARCWPWPVCATAGTPPRL